MSTIECQFCGARLILPEGDLPPEARCKRCGRRIEIKQARRTASTPSQSRRPSQVRPAQTASSMPPPRFEPLPKEAPRVDAYPRQSPPPAPARTVRSSNPWKLAGLSAAAVLGLAVTLVAVQQAMQGKATDGGPRAVSDVLPPASPALVSATAPAATSPPHDPGPENTSGSVQQASTKDAPPSTAQANQTKVGTGSAPTSDVQNGARAKQDQESPPARAAAPAVAQTDAMHGTKGLAKQIEAEPNFNATVYANSEISLRELERARLLLEESEQIGWFEKAFEPPYEGQVLDALKWVIRSKFASSAEWLFTTRPVFSVNLKHAPKGTRVKIQLMGLNEGSQRLLTSSQATAREWVTLDTDAHKDCVWFRKAGDRGSEDTWEIGLQPLWDIDKLASLEKSEHINLGVDISYGDGTTDDRHQVSVKVVPVQNVELGYPLALGFSGLINGGHPWIERILNDINQCSMAKQSGMTAGGGGSAENSFFGVFMLWRELRARGLRYQSLTGTADRNAIQSVRSIEDSLAAKNANCIDGSILFCSFFERMSLQCFLLMPPQHAFVEFFDGENYWELETTWLGKDEECSKEFRASVFEKFPKIKKLAGAFKGQEAKDFNSYLAALEAGWCEKFAEFKRAMEGDPKSKLPPVKALAEVLQQEGTSAERKQEAFDLIRSQYLSLYDLQSARAAGIEPVPIPKKFKSELPPQPARTR